jgi:hypothetical protein
LVGWLSGDDVATQYCKYFKVKKDIDNTAIIARYIMLKTEQTSLVLVIIITTTAIIAAATTTQILQPAYSQATHCLETSGTTTCTTPGQNPTFHRCDVEFGCGPIIPIPHQRAGQGIGGCHSTTTQGATAECTVTPP